MDKLKALFGTEALTFAQLEEKLKDNREIKLANLAGGGYVDRKKFEDKVAELNAANETIAALRDTVKQFDGVDVEQLKQDAAAWETKYNTDLEAAKIDTLLTYALVEARAKNPQTVKKLLDLSAIKRDGEKLLGVEEQLKALKASDGYAFEHEGTSGATVTTGASHTGSHGVDTFTAALMKGAGLKTPKGEE